MHWIIDNGHGIDTKGKRSPDGSLLEFDFNRKVATFLFELLTINQIYYTELIPEISDSELIKNELGITATPRSLNSLGLKSRVSRVNKICRKNEDCVLISIHGNAYGEGWTEPSGIETFINNQYNPAKPLAILFQSHLIEETGWRDRSVKYANFYILKHTICPAILTENGFYTNKEQCNLMKKEKIQYLIASAHFKAIQEIESL